MKIYYKIIMINLIIGLLGALPLFAMERTRGEKRKEANKFCQIYSDNTKHQRILEKGWNTLESAHFENGTPLPDDNWVEIFSSLERNDILHMSQVCQSWYNLTIDLYWSNIVIDRSDKLTFVDDLLDLFPNPTPYNIKVKLSEGESANLPLLQRCRQVSIIIANYDFNDYLTRYTKLAKRMEKTKNIKVFREMDRESFEKMDWRENDRLIQQKTAYSYKNYYKDNQQSKLGTFVYNPEYNNRALIPRLQSKMMHVNQIMMTSNSISDCFSRTPIFHLPALAHNLVFLDYPPPCQRSICVCEGNPCTCPPVSHLYYSFSLYAEFSHISHLSTLRSLTLEADSIPLSDLHYISVLTALTSLDMSNNSEDHQEGGDEIIKPFQPFSTLTNLTYLNLSEYNSWSSAGIDSLSTLTSLTELNLDSALEAVRFRERLEGAGFLNVSFLEKLTCLTDLNLSALACTRESLEVVSKLGQLKKLELSFMVLDDMSEKKILETISTFTTLKYLGLCNFAPTPLNEKWGGIIEYVKYDMSIEEFQSKYGIQYIAPYVHRPNMFLKGDLIEYFLPLKNLEKLNY